MAWIDLRSINLSVVVLLAGCTANPLFHVESDSGPTDVGTSTGDATNSGSSGLSTGEPPTSGGGDDTTAGVDDSGAMSSGDVVTTSGPGTSTSTGPGTTVDPDGGESEGSSGGDMGCGDGVVQAPEQCDDGMANGDDAACLSSCQLAVCGDGLVQAGVEECDMGPGNDDYGECTTACDFAACGDGFKQEPEGCDEGPENGKGLGKCSPDCVKTVDQKMLIRLSLNGISGSFMKEGLFGVEAADKLCQGFGPSFKAMLADGLTRRASQGPWQGGEAEWVLLPHTAYVNMDGDTVGVTGASRLFGAQYDPPGMLEAAIEPDGGLAWTGLNDDWTSADLNCEGWMSASDLKKGVVGDAKDTVENYLHAEGQEAVCAESRKLICVQKLG